MLKNIPVLLEGYKVQVTEEPTLKMIEKEDGSQVPATDFQGVQQHVVMLFVKPKPVNGERAGKGQEIKVTLETSPEDDVTDGALVEMINPRVSHWENDFNGRTMSGLSWRATGIKAVHR